MERLRQNQSQPGLFEPQKVVGIDTTDTTDTAADRGFSAGILVPFGELSSGLWNRLRLGFQQEFRAGIGLSAWRAGDTDSNFPARNVSQLETKDKPMIRSFLVRLLGVWKCCRPGVSPGISGGHFGAARMARAGPILTPIGVKSWLQAHQEIPR